MKKIGMIRVLSCLMLWALFLMACRALVGLWHVLGGVPQGDDFRAQALHIKWMMAFSIAMTLTTGIAAIWGTKLCLRCYKQGRDDVRPDA
jgi:purine-cytosine permease-like protein